jgi:hypothetical protein
VPACIVARKASIWRRLRFAAIYNDMTFTIV